MTEFKIFDIPLLAAGKFICKNISLLLTFFFITVKKQREILTKKQIVLDDCEEDEMNGNKTRPDRQV